jgi:hypothetical protein
MQNHLNKLNGKTFRYCGMLYKVLDTKIVNYKAVIKTDRQTFVKTESELNAFVDDIEFVKEKLVSPAEKLVEAIMSPKKEGEESEVFVSKSSVLQAEIIVAESNAQKVTNKLMDVFNELSSNPTDETYKKAQAMVNVSNSIVNLQIAQIKFLMLKK